MLPKKGGRGQNYSDCWLFCLCALERLLTTLSKIALGGFIDRFSPDIGMILAQINHI